MLRKKTNTNKSNLTTAATSARPKMITAHRSVARRTQSRGVNKQIHHIGFGTNRLEILTYL